MQSTIITSPFSTDLWRRVRKPVLSAFIAVHLCLAVCWLLPYWPVQQALAEAWKGYVLFVGLDQDFAMFAPDVRVFNLHIEAVVTYKDGSNRLYVYPRMERLSILNRMIKERYRKFGYDNIVRPIFSPLWPDFARFIARQSNVAPGENPPTRVTVLWYQSTIPPPQAGLGKPVPFQSQAHTLISLPIAKEDLQN
jgi:hypothetical protein